MNKLVESPEQAKQDLAYCNALRELLFQLADDDFIIAFRGSEWLGLAPHIEADVAYSSITQNTMGHAYMFYQLLEELGVGNADIIAHDRMAEERRNGTYLEKRNGEGVYFEEPYYDWALAIVRNFFYETFKQIKLKAITASSYQPLANVATKALMEHPYHLAHWKLWVQQIQNSSKEAKNRIAQRVLEAWEEFADVLELGELAEDMVRYNLISMDEAALRQEWLAAIKATVLDTPTIPLGKKYGNGRNGEHSGDLQQALATLAEVYNQDKSASW
ncbi:1,2-phenylacetyl-CoA epoxidase subunit PaaC [Ornithinibacillus contaminans]|uniref:1,2-phenylacetyl-CoA epoxidase subunit PaaC n=1 Tax=Ornithinibacillus contaminans TaxID=694055 RepID=UPI00064DD9A6|nr:1,2-phenylacetyl-CoA epoxidase subunit PaaC [Ornithinibacillus contaminans]